jgi:hypothetical protein
MLNSVVVLVIIGLGIWFCFWLEENTRYGKDTYDHYMKHGPNGDDHD